MFDSNCKVGWLSKTKPLQVFQAERDINKWVQWLQTILKGWEENNESFPVALRELGTFWNLRTLLVIIRAAKSPKSVIIATSRAAGKSHISWSPDTCPWSNNLASDYFPNLVKMNLIGRIESETFLAKDSRKWVIRLPVLW